MTLRKFPKLALLPSLIFIHMINVTAFYSNIFWLGRNTIWSILIYFDPFWTDLILNIMTIFILIFIEKCKTITNSSWLPEIMVHQSALKLWGLSLSRSRMSMIISHSLKKPMLMKTSGKIFVSVRNESILFRISKLYPENMKKLLSKVAHNWPPTFFLCTGPAAQTAQKQISRATRSPLVNAGLGI